MSIFGEKWANFNTFQNKSLAKELKLNLKLAFRLKSPFLYLIHQWAQIQTDLIWNSIFRTNIQHCTKQFMGA